MIGDHKGELVQSPPEERPATMAPSTIEQRRAKHRRSVRDGRRTRARPRNSIGALAVTIFGLTGLAIAVPLLTTLGPAATFFTAHRAGRGEVVAFTAALVLGPAALVLALLLLVRVVVPRRADSVADGIVGVFAAAVIGPILDRAIGLDTTTYLFSTAIVAAVVAALHARREPIRIFMRLTAVGPVIVVAWFLLFSSVSGLVLPQAFAGNAYARRNANVLFVIFDELPTVALMDEGREINAKRFPGFARLSKDGTWYRKTTTVSPWTHLAVPAIFSGKIPKAKPSSSTYASNVFSMLEATHDLVPLELVTHLCRTRACGAAKPEMDRLFDDSLIIYSHALLPDETADQLVPAIGDRWANFRGTGGDTPVITKHNKPDESRRFSLLLDSIRGSRDARPEAWVAHFRVPHMPLSYLPDGRHYDARKPPGLMHAVEWERQQPAIDVARQRFLLQVRYVDRLVERMLEALERTGQYDNTLIVITSDHGVSFRPGHRRGVPTRVATAGDVVRVPLFVKYPGQRSASVDDRPAQVFDIMPTVADALDVSLPKSWRFDGHSLLGDEPPTGVTRYMERNAGARILPQIVDTKRGIRGYVELFGEWRGEHDTFAWGPYWHLLGAEAEQLRPGRSSSRARVVSPKSMYYEEDEELTPALVELALDRSPSSGWIAVALNGRIAGLGRTYVHRGKDRAMAMVDPAFLRDGMNLLEAFFVRSPGTLQRIGIVGER